VKAGWLHKRSRFLKTWKRYWCELGTNQLAVYATPKVLSCVYVPLWWWWSLDGWGCSHQQSVQPQTLIKSSDVISVEPYDRMKHGRVMGWPTQHRVVIMLRLERKVKRYFFASEQASGVQSWITSLQIYLKLLRAGSVHRLHRFVCFCAPSAVFTHSSPRVCCWLLCFVAGVDWNGCFQTMRSQFRTIVEAPDALSHLRSLTSFTRRFEVVALTLAITIVQEAALPQYMQSLSPPRTGDHVLFHGAGLAIKLVFSDDDAHQTFAQKVRSAATSCSV